MLKVSHSFSRPYSKFFSKSPLNHETYENRLKRFKKLYPIRAKDDSLGSLAPTELFLDCVEANRLLQKPKRFSIDGVLDDTFLGKYDNTKVEKGLWKFLFENYRQQANDRVVKSYICTPPVPSLILEVTKANFYHNLSRLNAKIFNFRQVDTSVVYTALNKLLDSKDYYGAFKLVESTLGSSLYYKHRKHLLISAGMGLGVFNLAATSGLILIPSIPPLFYILTNVLLTFGLVYGLVRFQLAEHLGRLSWRPHNSKWHNYLHHEELIAINKIIFHFEEHNEVNIRNFHHSKVRKLSNLKMFDQNDYVLELPNTNTDLVVSDSFHEEHDILQLQQYFRIQLNSRKMVLNDLQQELMFLEFWLTHGENYVWVEPDQDPAEILKLEINEGVNRE